MSITPHNIKKQSGVSIVTAIFLVVVLALMGAGMVSLLSTSQQSISQEITSAKTYMAGRSCLQWGMYQAVYNATTGTHTNTFNNVNSSLFNSQCSTTIDTITADSLIFYNITAIANFGAVTDPEYSQRTMRLQFQP
ncbi:MAG: hypothetical protein QM484_13180 [Woeseiaceae bacterium]